MSLMEGQLIIDKTREYLDYLEGHLVNVEKAFIEVSKKCEGMPWVGDDRTWFNIRQDISQHDLSKFSPDEFTQYREHFYPTVNETKGSLGSAWEHHKICNSHHWESAETENDIVHMIIDWQAMSYTNNTFPEQYYNKHKDIIKLDLELHNFMFEIFKRIR